MKVYCDACDWKGTRKEVLKAESPFDPMDTIEGCPVCKSVHTMIEACDVDGCFKQTSCGFPTDNGYMRTCGKHYTELNPK